MLAAGITAPVPLEELEIHLREDVEQQMRLEASAAQAFAAAVRRIGPARDIQAEFSKTGGTPWSGLAWWLWLWIGSFGLAQTVVLNLVGPSVFHRHASDFFSPKWWADWFPSYLVWIAFALMGSAIGFAKWRSQRQAAGR